MSLAAGSATSLAGQDTLIARLRTRADSLKRVWQQAQVIANLSDSLERERAVAGRDTIAVGGLRILANPSPLPLRDAAARAWPAIDSLYGSAAGDLVNRPYLIRAVDPDPMVRRRVLHVGLELPWDLDVRAMTTVLLVNVPIASPDPALAEWLGANLRPSVRAGDDRRTVYLQLVTAPSQTVRDCLLGDIARCRDALQLGDTSDLLTSWYRSPAERRALLAGSFAEFFNRGATAEPFRACMARTDAACTQLLRSLPPGTLPKPLAHAARATLVREALRRGGRDSYRRLLEPRPLIADRVAAAAGIGVDSVIAEWRRTILSARPPTVTLPWWAYVAAVSWTALFAACGMRSSRWRL
jgi:hypothetical protein